MQTIDELKYSQSVWGFQPRKAEIRKGGDALKMLSSRIWRSGAKIRYVCMDMSNAYAAWAKEALPKAETVYDRFHLMKMMNERLDGVRRRVARKLDEDAAKDLKGKRFVLLRNEDDLDGKGAEVSSA